ncbi:MAG: hypothetical protein KJI69_02120 [Patescibacteria group bacterium]|nr:hypothetical protein [Patescibacteria group bacterium]
MKSKFIIGAVGILLVFGGILLFLNKTEEEEFILTPTKWSQEEDYKISETSEGTIVTNESAGFRFKVPDGWSVKGEQEDDEFWIAAFSQDVEFRDEVVIAKGCGINVSFQDISDFVEVNTIKGRMADLYDNEDIIKVSNYDGFQVVDRYEDPKIFSKYGTHIVVLVPLNNEDILSISTILFRNNCEADFQKLLEGFEIN